MTRLAVARKRAFTLVELIVVIVVLAILSGVAIPKYFDYVSSAKESATRGTLGAVRSAIANFRANALVSTGAEAYPSLVQIQTVGTVMQEAIPKNPYNNDNTIGAASYATTPPVSGTHGWSYDAAVGKFWANSDTGATDENTW